MLCVVCYVSCVVRCLSFDGCCLLFVVYVSIVVCCLLFAVCCVFVAGLLDGL